MKTMEEKIFGLIMDHEKNGNVYHTRKDIIAWTQGRWFALETIMQSRKPAMPRIRPPG